MCNDGNGRFVPWLYFHPPSRIILFYMKTERLTRTDILLLIAFLLLAGVLRMGWPGLTEFKADEARLLALAYDMAEGTFARRGISSSVGFPNFPMSVWLYAIPSVVWAHPYAATLFTGLLNTLAVGGTYWLVRRFWGRPAAVVAALMLAVSPWAIIFSRKIWAQNLLPLFVLGWGGGALLAFAARRPRFLALHLLCLAVAVQIHLAAAALIPATAVLLLVFWRRINWRWLGMGALLAAGTAVPFLTYLWEEGGDMGAVLGGEGSGFTVSPDALRHTWTLSAGADIHSLAGPEAYTDYLAQAPPALQGMAIGLWSVFIGGGILWLLLLVGRRALTIVRHVSSTTHYLPSTDHSSGDAAFIILVWLLAPPLFFLWHRTPVFIHYFIATLPAQYVAAGALIGQLATANRQPSIINGERNTQHVSRILGILVAATAVIHLYSWGTLLAFLGTRATPGGFGTPLAMQLEAVETAVAPVEQGDAAEVLVAGRGESPRIDEIPAVYDTLLRDVPHRFVDVTDSAVFPAEAATVLLVADDAAAAALYTAAASQITPIPLREGAGTLPVLALPPAAAPAPTVVLDEPPLLANWVRLLGYTWEKREETAVWRVHWRPGDNPDPADYHFFNHLLTAGGERIAQADAAAFSPGQWRAGDRIVSHFLLELPDAAPAPYTMRVGMYHYPSLEPAPLLDEAGNPYSDAAEITLP